jgi:hypothetical protein
MTGKSYLLPKYRTFIYGKYNIIKEFKILDYVSDYTVLKEELAETKKEVYEHNERYLVFQRDDAFYLPGVPYSLTIYNLIITFIQLDIPLSTILFFTNTFSKEQEVAYLLDSLKVDKNDRPTIIESFCNCTFLFEEYQNIDLSINSIKKNAVCMMAGTNRPHRNALYNFLLENNLLGNTSVSISPPGYHKPK